MRQKETGETFSGKKTMREEYPRDFGNLESEDMLIEFFPKFVPGVARAERASWFDDENGVDVVAHLENGKTIAVQWTITDSPGRRRGKIDELMRGPFMHLHDEKGNVVSEERVLRVVLYADKKKWARAWKNGGGDISKAVSSLEDPEELGRKLAGKTCEAIGILLSEAKSVGNPERKEMRQIREFLLSKISESQSVAV